MLLFPGLLANSAPCPDWFFCSYSEITLAGMKLPGLGINPSHLLFMMVPYVVTVVVVYHVALKPLVKIIEERERRTEGARAEAVELEAKFTEKLKAYEARLAETRQKASDERARIRKEGALQEAKILGGAREEAAKQVEDVRAQVAAERERVRVELRKQAEQLGLELASSALGREIAPGGPPGGTVKGGTRAGATS